MPATGHALLGASGAARWIACPPSARLEERCGAPDEGSPWAEEGTAAHAYAELLLRNRIGTLSNRSFAARMRKVKAGGHWSDEMRDAVGAYADCVCRVWDAAGGRGRAFVEIERRVDLTRWVPAGFGTADAIVMGGGTLHVLDLKYGKGVPVEAEGNPQIRLYALGALEAYGLAMRFDDVAMTICQPRLGAESTARMPVSDLLAWGDRVVAPAARLAWDGEGDFAPSEEACRWCRAKEACGARAAWALAEAGAGTPDEPSATGLPAPETLTDGQVARLLPVLPEIEGWSRDVREWALRQAVDEGRRWPGYKLVEGRTRRTIADQEAAIGAAVAAGFDADEVAEVRLKGVTALTKAMGKERFEAVMGPYVTKPAGRPCLVPESDKRPEMDMAAIAAAEFKEQK